MSLHLREKHESRLAKLRTERSSFEPHWRELTDFVLPRRGRYFDTDRNKGNKRNQNIIDNTATLAQRTLVSGLMSGLTSPARPWFNIGTEDPELMEFGPVKVWLQEVARRMRQVFNRSNLYQALPLAYGELGTFGTGSFLLGEDFRKGIWCYPYTVGEYFLGINQFNQVDTLYRESPWTIGQIVQKFGLENVSKSIKNLYDKNILDDYVTLIHVIEPNDDRVPGKKDSKNFPWRSVWYEKNSSKDQMLGISGYHEFPVMAPRWHVNSGDVYGTMCPGMDALGDIKQLQIEQKRKGQAIDKMVNPPMTAPSSLKSKKASVIAGGITYVDFNAGMQGFQPTYQVNINLRELKEDIADVRYRISRAYYEDLFLLISQTPGDVTATEILERKEEKLIVLGPVVERFINELLDPIIDRTFGIMSRNNMIPPPPEDIQGRELKIEYISLLAQAQKTIGLSSNDRLISSVGSISAMSPSILDKIDFDQYVDVQSDLLGTDARIVRGDEAVREIRENRAKIAAQQEQQAQLANNAQAAKVLSETNTGGDNALTELLGL